MYVKRGLFLIALLRSILTKQVLLELSLLSSPIICCNIRARQETHLSFKQLPVFKFFFFFNEAVFFSFLTKHFFNYVRLFLFFSPPFKLSVIDYDGSFPFYFMKGGLHKECTCYKALHVEHTVQYRAPFPLCFPRVKLCVNILGVYE